MTQSQVDHKQMTALVTVAEAEHKRLMTETGNRMDNGSSECTTDTYTLYRAAMSPEINTLNNEMQPNRRNQTYLEMLEEDSEMESYESDVSDLGTIREETTSDVPYPIINHQSDPTMVSGSKLPTITSINLTNSASMIHTNVLQPIIQDWTHGMWANHCHGLNLHLQAAEAQLTQTRLMITASIESQNFYIETISQLKLIIDNQNQYIRQLEDYNQEIWQTQIDLLPDVSTILNTLNPSFPENEWNGH